MKTSCSCHIGNACLGRTLTLCVMPVSLFDRFCRRSRPHLVGRSRCVQFVRVCLAQRRLPFRALHTIAQSRVSHPLFVGHALSPDPFCAFCNLTRRVCHFPHHKPSHGCQSALWRAMPFMVHPTARRLRIVGACTPPLSSMCVKAAHTGCFLQGTSAFHSRLGGWTGGAF